MAVAASVKSMYSESTDLQKRFLKGHVTVGRVLGKGAFGKVMELFIAGTRYAGKQFHDMLLGAEVSCIIQKFIEECRLMAEVKHPNIVQFMGICMLEGSEHPVLVMEYLDMSLDALLESRQGHIPLAVKLRILLDIVRGLLYLHTHDPVIIHRDITSRNVLLNRASLQAKIADLGNALMTESKHFMNSLSKMPGTPLYMPPEANGASPKYDTSLDMFSFGHLALYVAIEIFPDDLLPATTVDPSTEKIVGCSEVERRQFYFNMLYDSKDVGRDHPLSKLIESCLSNLPNKRPTAEAVFEVLEFQVSAQEDPYSALEDFCQLDLLELAQGGGETSQAVTTNQSSSSLYLHPIKAHVQELKDGKPGLMEMYEKRSSLLIGFGASMEWNQYVFIIKDQHLKYYRSSKPSKIIGEIELQKVLSVSPFVSLDKQKFYFQICFEIESKSKLSRTVTSSTGSWLLSTFTAEERVNWMEAIRPGSVAKYNLLKVSESTDLGASGGKLKIFDIGMGLRAESDEKKHQNEGTEEVARTFPDKDNDALGNHSNDTASSSSATIVDDPYEDIDKLYYDDIANEKRYPSSKAIAIYETPADQLETNIDKGDDSTDSVSAQFINKGSPNLASNLSQYPPRVFSSPVLPQGPQPQKSNIPLPVLGTNPSDIKASNSVNEYEYVEVPSTSTRAHPLPPLTSQLLQESSNKSAQSSSGDRECSYQLQHPRSPTTKLVSPSSESQLSSSPSSRPPLPPPKHSTLLSNRLSSSPPKPPKPPKPPVSIPQSPSTPSKLALISPSNLSTSATAADQETVKVSSSQLQQIVQNVVQETVGKLLKKDTTSEQNCEESEAADDQTQQLTLEHLSQPTSSRKRNVYEGDRGFPATKKVEESCSPMSNVTTKPVPPVPKPKPRNLSRNKLETQVESEKSGPRNRSNSIKWLRSESDDEDAYVPRPKWAKAATRVPLKDEDSLDLLRCQALFIPRSKIQNLKLIGQGQYGEVYKAEYAKGTKSNLTVAVKAIKKYQSQKAHDDFLKEMDIMSQFVHPNIIKLYGLVQQDSPWIVLEYLENGDLGNFLKRNPRPVGVLIKYMLDIATGMHYIAEKGLVHRDIAARNIIVGSSESTEKTETCKISDFGLLREIPKDDSIYVSKQGGPVPVRWMAPESLSRREFSTASDVWSYGVLLWEMRYPTIIPYTEIKSNMEVATQVTDGFRLNIPSDYPDVVQRIIKACWQKEPSKRPSFLLISNLLSNEIDFCH